MITNQDDHDYGYGDTLGWSGSDTSRERAEDEANSGLASARLSLAHDLVNEAGYYGLTYRELGGLTGWHHGQSSGVLSNLHKQGYIARLSDSRSRCKIYVTLDHVDGRTTEKHGRQGNSKALLTSTDIHSLVEARDKARALYKGSPSVGVWEDIPSYVAFWKVITKIILDYEKNGDNGNRGS